MEEERYSNRQKYHLEHIVQYVLLVIVFVFSISLLFQLTDFVLKLAVISFLSLCYLVWGIWHHWEENNLTRTHVLEYLVISVLIFTVLTFVFLNR